MAFETIVWSVTITISCGLFLYFVREEGRRILIQYPLFFGLIALLGICLYRGATFDYKILAGEEFSSTEAIIYAFKEGGLKVSLMMYFSCFFTALGLFSFIVVTVDMLRTEKEIED